MKIEEQQLFYTIQQVADLLGVDRRTVTKYIKTGKIRAVTLSPRTTRIPVSEISFLFLEEKE